MNARRKPALELAVLFALLPFAAAFRGVQPSEERQDPPPEQPAPAPTPAPPEAPAPSSAQPPSAPAAQESATAAASAGGGLAAGAAAVAAARPAAEASAVGEAARAASGKASAVKSHLHEGSEEELNGIFDQNSRRGDVRKAPSGTAALDAEGESVPRTGVHDPWQDLTVSIETEVPPEPDAAGKQAVSKPVGPLQLAVSHAADEALESVGAVVAPAPLAEQAVRPAAPVPFLAATSEPEAFAGDHPSAPGAWGAFRTGLFGGGGGPRSSSTVGGGGGRWMRVRAGLFGLRRKWVFVPAGAGGGGGSAGGPSFEPSGGGALPPAGETSAPATAPAPSASATGPTAHEAQLMDRLRRPSGDLASDLEAMRRLSAAIGRGESLGAFRRRLGGTNVFLEARSRVFPPEARREMLAAVVDVVARLDGRQDEADYRAVMNVLDAFNFINADPATRELVRSRLVPLLAADPDGEGGAAAATRRRFVYDALWPLGVHAWTDLSEREVFRPFTAALVREARDESLPAAVRMESLRILTDALPGYDGYLARAPYIVPNVLSPIRDLANAGDGEVNRRAVAALRRVLESESHDHRLTGMEPWAHSYFRAEEFLRSGRIVRAREIPQEEWSPGMR